MVEYPNLYVLHYIWSTQRGFTARRYAVVQTIRHITPIIALSAFN